MSADWASYSVNLTQNGWNQHIGPRILWTKHKMDEKLPPNFTSFSKEQWLCIPMIFFFIEVISSFIRFTSMESALSPVGPSTERTWSCKAFVESMRENYSQSFISRQYFRLRVVANFGEIHIREWATYTHHARRGGHETRMKRRVSAAHTCIFHVRCLSPKFETTHSQIELKVSAIESDNLAEWTSVQEIETTVFLMTSLKLVTRLIFIKVVHYWVKTIVSFTLIWMTIFLI